MREGGDGPFLMRRGLWGRDTNPNKAKEEKTELMEHKQRALTLPERGLACYRLDKQAKKWTLIRTVVLPRGRPPHRGGTPWMSREFVTGSHLSRKTIPDMMMKVRGAETGTI